MIPPTFTLLIPALATVIAGWLKSDALPGWANDLIVCLAFTAAVVVSVLLSGGFTASMGMNLTLIISACAAIFALLRPFMQEATAALPSPLVRRVRLVRRVAGQGASSQAVTPVSPRASVSAAERYIDGANLDTMKVKALNDFNKVPQRQMVRITPNPARPLRPAQPTSPPEATESPEDPPEASAAVPS